MNEYLEEIYANKELVEKQRKERSRQYQRSYRKYGVKRPFLLKDLSKDGRVPYAYYDD